MFKIKEKINTFKNSSTLEKILDVFSSNYFKKFFICFIVFFSIFSFFYNPQHALAGHLTVMYAGNGTGSSSGEGDYYDQYVDVYAYPDPGSHLSSFSDACYDYGGGYGEVFVGYYDYPTCVITFDRDYYFLTTWTTGSGSGTVNGGGAYYPYDYAYPEAVPDPGSYFAGWDNPGLCGNGYMVMDNDYWCTAIFYPYSYDVHATAGNAGGGVSPADQYLGYNATTTITAFPDSGYHTASASGCGGYLSGNTFYTGLVTSDCTVTFYFDLNDCYSGPAGYTRCSAEDGTCSFSGDAKVAYGCSGSYVYQDHTSSTSCTNGQYGDPLPGYKKACFYQSECLNTPWGTMTDGSTNVGYLASSVPFGSSCISQTRTCSGGSMDGSYYITSCTVDAPANCSGTWGTVNHGSSLTTYSTSSAVYPTTCSSNGSQACYNGGGMSGYSSCTQYYVASFDSNGGSPSYSSANYTAGAAVSSPGSPTRSGYTFAGWGLGNMPSNNTTYYAQWTDTTAPSTPGALTTTWVGDHFVNTNFTASTSGASDGQSGIRGYRLCRSYDNASGCSVWTANGEHSGLSEVVSGGDLPGVGNYKYYYWYAYDNAGNESPVSGAVYVRMDGARPTTPGIMTTSWAGDHYVDTSFTASTSGSTDPSVGSGISYYNLCRSLDNSSGCNTWVATGVWTSTTVSGSNLPSPNNYRYYYWYAYDAVGNESLQSAGEYIRMNTPPPISTPISPGNGSTFAGGGSSSVTFSTNGVSDVQGQTVQYYFRVATGSDGESGQVCNSGWQAGASYTCNPGYGTFYWHVYTYDGVTQTNPNYTWSFIVTKTNQAGLSLTNTTGTYGSGLTVGSSGGSGSGAVTYTLSSAGTAGCSVASTTGVVTFSSAGTCTINVDKAADTNYNAASSGATTVTINKSGQSALTLTSTSGTYPTAVALTSSGGSGSGSVTYSTTAGTAGCSVSGTTLNYSNAGTCAVTATKAADTNYNAISSSATTVTINKITPTASITNSPVNYNGGVQTAAVACLGGGAATLASGGTGTNVGSYPATVNCGASTNYTASNGLAAGSFVINQIAQTASISTASTPYTGSLISRAVTCSGGGTPTPSTVSGTNAGSYTATISCAATTNYSATGSLNPGSFSITQITPTASITNSPVNYNGSTQTATVACLGGGTATLASGGSGVNAGSYPATVNCGASTNYTASNGLAAGSFVINQIAQSALSISTTSTTYPNTLGLLTSGGSGTGGVSYVVNSGNCTIAGSTLTPTGAGSCSVTATKAADTNYTVISSSATTITINMGTQAALTFGGQTVTYPTTFTALSTTGGTGAGAVTYAVTTPGAGCSIAGATLSYTSAGSCGVTATKAADSNYNATTAVATFTINQSAQSALSVTGTSGTYPTGWTVGTSGGSGTGAVTYTVANGTATGCSIVSGTGALTFTSAGTCIVTATKAADTNYTIISSVGTTVTINAVAPSISSPTSTSITTTTATLGATVTSGGGIALTARGTCYSTVSGNATIALGTCLSEGGTAISLFTQARTSLTSATHYYFQGYATNSVGTSYSGEGSFYTQSTLTYIAGSNGTLSGSTSQNISYGSSGSAVTAIPNANYHFVNWSDSSVQNPRTDINVTTNISVTANFAIDTFTVSTSANVGGTISPSSQIVNYGSTTTFTITPDLHYIVSANGCGGSLIGTTYTTGVITNICTVTALFTQIILPTITTGVASGITINSATFGGNITDIGNETNDKRGIVYDTVSHAAPGNIAPASSLYPSKVEQAGSYGTGSFASSMSGLVSGTTYYVRSYSHNSIGYSYGSEVSFATDPFPTVTQSSYRLFDNINSTNVSSALSSQNASYTLPNSGDDFRLRLLIGVSVSTLPINIGNFKLQYALKVGTCDTGFVGESYSDVTSQTDVAYNKNFGVDNGFSVSTNVNDPTHNVDTVLNQTYVDSGNFTNSVSALTPSQYGKWDFSLYDKANRSDTAYCFRVVKSNGSLLDVYSYIPEIMTATYKSRGGGSSNFENSVTPNAPATGGNNNSGGVNIEAPVKSPDTNNGGGNQGGGQGDLGFLYGNKYSIFNLIKNSLLKNSMSALALNYLIK